MSEIKQFAGYQAIQEVPHIQLPRGGYIAQIIGTKLDSSRNAKQRLLIQVEITEGAYANFFHRDYEARKASPYEAKYHGVYSISVPNGDGTESDLRDLERFNRTIGAIEGSNPGYQWDWHLSSLVGRSVGLSVREYEFRGGVYTEIGKFIPTTTIRNGLFQPMNRRIAQEPSGTPQSTAGSTPIIPGLARPAVPAQPIIPQPAYVQSAQPQSASNVPAAQTGNGYAPCSDDEPPF